MIEKILPLFVIFFLGYVLKRLGLFGPTDSASYSRLVMYVIIPAMALKVFSTIEVSATLLYLPLAAVIVIVLLLGVAWVASFVMPDKRRNLFLIFPTLEGGGIAYPIMLSVFGETGLARTVLFDVGNALMLFTVVYVIAAGGNDWLRKLSRQPILYVIALGIVLNVFNLTPLIFTTILDTIFAALVLVIMFMLGIDFRLNLSHFGRGAIVTVAKTSLGLGFGLLVIQLFGFTGIDRMAVLVMCALPPSIITFAYAKENRMDTEFLANVFSFSIPFSLIVITALIYFA
ncbi:MAG: AEC family transporter [Nanobdellota archaeon]